MIDKMYIYNTGIAKKIYTAKVIQEGEEIPYLHIHHLGNIKKIISRFGLLRSCKDIQCSLIQNREECSNNNCSEFTSNLHIIVDKSCFDIENGFIMLKENLISLLQFAKSLTCTILNWKGESMVC